MKTFKTLSIRKILLIPLILIFTFGAYFAQAQCNADFELLNQDTCGLVTFNSTYDGSNTLTFSWDFGDGNTSTSKTPMHQYANAGNYTICLAVSDGNGCVDTICNPLEVAVCSSNACDGLDISCTDEIDILFILDNSGSISSTEFNQMKVLVQNTITDINNAYSNVLFSVSHYGGNAGGEVQIQSDFTPKGSLPPISRYTSGNDDMNQALGGIVDALAAAPAAPTNPNVIGAFANRRPTAKLFVIIFTDAYPNALSYGSSMVPYTNSNVLKSTYNANITLVHLNSNILSALPVGAAIASQGGSYTGSVISNPGDVTNPTGPRQFIPALFTTTSIDILPEFPSCDSIDIDFPCENLGVALTSGSSDSCCYSIDFTNNVGSDIILVEAEMLTPGWLFNTSAVSTGFTWSMTPTNTLLGVKNPGGIPSGTTTGALNHCFMKDVTNLPAGNSYQVEYRWYCGEGDDKKLVCRDTLKFECNDIKDDNCLDVVIESVQCDPDNPYEYFVNFTVTNNSGFPATNIVLQNLDPLFRFKDCSTTTPGGGFSFINIPLSPTPLPSTATSSTLCVKILSNHIVFSQETLCFKAGLISPTDCCHSPTEICIDIESCCSPCGEISVDSKPMSVGNASCCYSLDVIDSCGYQYFTKIETEIITPGVIFGYHALGGTDAGNWWIPSSSPTAISWASKSGHIPYGKTIDIMQFCLDNINTPSQSPQTILIKYYTLGSGGQDSVACVDTLITDCDPPSNNSCLEVYGQNLTCNLDSNCYEYGFWVKNTSSVPFNADWLDAFIQTPGFNFPSPGGTFPLSPALAVGDSAYITTCIQSTPFPALADSIVLSYRLRFNMGDTCCYESIYDTLAMPPCTCCETNTVTPTAKDSCCYSLDIDVVCDELSFTKVEIEILTGGVIFGAHFTGGANPGDWTNPISLPQRVQWEHISGSIPVGNYPDLINFCLDNIFYASQTPQQIMFKWMTPDISGKDSIVCEELLTFDCNPPVDNKCIYLKNSDLKCNPNGDYILNYEVCNVSSPMNTADYLVVFPIGPTGATITPTTIPVNLPPGVCYIDSFNVSNIISGDTLRFALRLMNSLSDSSWCCFEGDTVEIIVPDCCCFDATQFTTNVDSGFTITTGVTDTIISLQSVHNFDSCYTILWNFGDGNTTTTMGSQVVNHIYSKSQKYNICMTVTGAGCGSKEVCKDHGKDSTPKKCDPTKVTLNNGLTPNGDGFNDVLDLQGIANCQNIRLQIYNRWGNKVYEQNSYESGPQWDGISDRNRPLPVGTYYYIIDFLDDNVRKTGPLDIRR